MDDKTVIVERKGPIGWITLNRPDQLNTFIPALAEELNAALDDLEKDPSIRVVVIKGAGRGFSAGIDLSDFLGKDLMEYRRWITLMDRMNHTIANMGKPVIAAVHGFAAANGCGLVAACDLAIAAEGTKFGTTAINVGLFCMGPSIPLSRSLGKKHCLEMLLTGDLIDAEKAERIGLINKVVPREKLDEEVLALATHLASKSPVALQMGKHAFYTMSDMEFHKAFEYMGEMMAELCTTEDARKGVEAFLKKK